MVSCRESCREAVPGSDALLTCTDVVIQAEVTIQNIFSSQLNAKCLPTSLTTSSSHHDHSNLPRHLWQSARNTSQIPPMASGYIRRPDQRRQCLPFQSKGWQLRLAWRSNRTRRGSEVRSHTRSQRGDWSRCRRTNSAGSRVEPLPGFSFG